MSARVCVVPLRLIITAAFALALVVSSGCANTRQRKPVPENLEDRVSPLGNHLIRTWGEKVTDAYIQSMADSVRQERAHYAANPTLTPPKTLDILALSGGGEDGAFGAGLLCGWTKHGDRPQFKLVTGVSTGALIAPWAFLGSAYDDTLRESYTKVTKNDIFRMRSIFNLIGADGITDTSPLRKLVTKNVDQKILDAIAAEHRKGRRLLISTSNLDAQRPVIWDVGAIACSGDPRAIQLFRDVLIASASIPVAFPPVYISVEADGKRYDEMHVDGATFTQVFLWGGGFSAALAAEKLGADALKRKARLFIIRNSMVSPGYEQVSPKLFPIAGRAIATMIMANGTNDLIRLHAIAMRDEIDFNLAYIPPKAGGEMKEPFDREYMQRLFDYGFDSATRGYPWLKAPPINLAGTAGSLRSNGDEGRPE